MKVPQGYQCDVEVQRGDQADTQVQGGAEICMEVPQGYQGDVEVQKGTENHVQLLERDADVRKTIQTRLEVEQNISWREFQTKAN